MNYLLTDRVELVAAWLEMTINELVSLGKASVRSWEVTWLRLWHLLVRFDGN